MSHVFKIAISVGELSGDQHAARLVEALHRRIPALEVRGMTGPNLRALGVETVVDIQRGASVNGFNLPSMLGRSLRSARAMLRMIRTWQPDVLIVVDYPDFNLRLAKIAARLFHVPIIYFIPPKMWAWRAGRIAHFKDFVQSTISILPFEREFFEKAGYRKSVFVGHPFADTLKSGSDWNNDRELLKTLQLNPAQPTVAVFPGSRPSEVRRHIPIMVSGLKLLHEKHPEVQAVIAIAPNINESEIKPFVDGKPWLAATSVDSLAILRATDAGLLKCGTCNLEAAFLALPSVIFYTAPRFSELMVRLFVRLKSYSLLNIIRPGSAVELIQQTATPANVCSELEGLIYDEHKRSEARRNLAEVVDLLQSHDEHEAFRGCSTAVERAAGLVHHTIKTTRRAARGEFYSRMLAYLKPYKAQFFFALVCMILFGASDGAIPFMIKYILEGVFANQDEALLASLPVLLVTFVVLRATVDFGQHFLLARVGHNIVRDIRNQTNRHLLSLSSGYFHKNSSGDILARFTSDVELVRGLLTNSISAMLGDSMRILCLLAAAVWLDPLLALIALIVFPLGVLPVYNFGRRMRRLSKRGQDAIGAISGLVQETVTGNRVVKIFCREEFEQERFERENNKVNRTFVKSEIVRALTGPVNEVLAAIGISAVILYGGYSVIGGTRSEGQFIAFLFAIFLLYEPFKKLSRINNVVQQGISGAERIFELLDSRPEISDPPQPLPMPASNALGFDGVAFTYGGNDDTPVLQDISFDVREGEKLAIVGFSGSGKTTLVNLIPRFMDPQSGHVTIGGVDVRGLRLAELRSRIAMVNQHTFLFNASIYENIAYGKENATREEIIQAARAAFAFEFIMKLPAGFDTIVGEGGYTLSGGERQRIAIARALLKDAPILILDEATASLDNRSEREVQDALEVLTKERTTVVIAHRLSTIRSADRIIVMDSGRIVEAGRHGELLAAGGAFARLYALQFSEQESGQAIGQHA